MPSRIHRLRRTLCASLTLLAALLIAPAARATQVVYLNFDRTGGDDIEFSQAEMDFIQASVVKDFALFDFQITQTEPTSGEYSSLFFNDGPAGGVADGIDFRNVNQSDSARIQTRSLLIQFGIDPDSPVLTEDFLQLTANIASHEMGHILGLRHYDSLGAVGNGFSSDPSFMFLNGSPGGGYGGAFAAEDTINHLIETGISQANLPTVNQKYFGPREAIKLSFNESGSVVDETSGSKQTLAQAQPVTLANLDVPNTVELGDLTRQEFEVEAVVVTGAISAALQKDHYSFEGVEGEVLNIELKSSSLGPGVLGGNGRYGNTIGSRLSLLDANGDPVDYYGVDAVSEVDFEGRNEGLIFDWIIPSTDTYFIKVESVPDPISGTNFDTGNYELFINTFSAVELAPGDFNRDGMVDNADYTLWRDTNGDDVDPGTGADTDFNGKIDFVDYQKWADNYGAIAMDVIPANALPMGGATSVPEPASALLAGLLLGIAGLSGRRVA